jgi:hypothetical protein
MLRCDECGGEARTAEEALGWRAFLAAAGPSEQDDVTGHDYDETPIVTLYCPECANREFG